MQHLYFQIIFSFNPLHIFLILNNFLLKFSFKFLSLRNKKFNFIGFLFFFGWNLNSYFFLFQSNFQIKFNNSVICYWYLTKILLNNVKQMFCILDQINHLHLIIDIVLINIFFKKVFAESINQRYLQMFLIFQFLYSKINCKSIFLTIKLRRNLFCLVTHLCYI